MSELVPLVGTWRLVLWGGSFLPVPEERVDAGTVSFTWIVDGAVLTMHQGGDDRAPPAARMINGRDQDQDHYTVLYSDARGVSRVCTMSFTSGEWLFWRDNPSFAQRFEASLSADVQLIQDRLAIRYWLRGHEDRWYVGEQQVYCDVRGDLIERMDLLCSGFRPETQMASA